MDGGPFQARFWTSAPLKPSVGLSGAFQRLDRAFLMHARVFARCIRTQFQLVPRSPLRDGESCSTASLRCARRVAMNVVEFLYKLRVIANVGVVVALLPEMVGGSKVKGLSPQGGTEDHRGNRRLINVDLFDALHSGVALGFADQSERDRA
jgi:hypothetical protein